MKRVLILPMVALGSLTFSALQAPAQNPRILQQQAPNMPAPQDMPAEKIEPNSPSAADPSATGSTETLSEKLEATDGVIRPPVTGTPDMTVTPPVPNPGTTPVIPPPGSPGGNPTVEPK